MPVTLIPPRTHSKRSLPARQHSLSDSSGRRQIPDSPLSIGLLNNMPDSALEATERQFISLLNAASDGFPVRLSLFYLPGVPRGEAVRAQIERRYSSADLLGESGLDGLIVTGREPLCPSLQGEPYWNHFVRTLEWAREKTFSTVWSCLAAHAAVLHLDGIQRRRSEQKHCGIFECERVLDHPVTANLPARFHLPHSRWNGLPEEELARSGYRILSRAGEAGVDCFVKEEHSLFLFLQGHPEYEAETLLLEYRRDVARYLRGECPTYPNVPRGYFDQNGMEELMRIQRGSATRPQEETLAMLSALQPALISNDGWSAAAATLYGNWLAYIHEGKMSCLTSASAERAKGGFPLTDAVPSTTVELAAIPADH
jgi:homoserine O-succinyltransferase/O-acetyltransferase